MNRELRYEYWEILTGRWNLIPKNRKNQLIDRYGYPTRIRDPKNQTKFRYP